MDSLCPRCQVPLAVSRSPTGVHLVCPRCAGRSVNLSLLRRELDSSFIGNLWRQVKDAPPSHHGNALVCPYCRNKMHAAGITRGEDEFQIDVCRGCQAIWMDRGEIESLPGHGKTPAFTEADRKAAMPMAAREILATREIEKVRRHADTRWIRGIPDEPWKAVITLLGLPAEDEPPPLTSRPYLTWVLILMCVVTFVFMQAIGAESFIRQFGFIPSAAWRDNGLTLLTSFFVHGGIWHLVANLWFLHLVGDNCESRLGPIRFFLLVAAGTVGGILLHSLLDPRDSVPLIGASAGISALIVYYGLSWPSTRLVVGMRFGVIPFWFRIRAMSALGLWLASQAFLAFWQHHGLTNVSAFAHLGGAMAGLAGYAGLRWKNKAFKWRRNPKEGDFSDPGAVAASLRKKAGRRA